MGGGLRSTGKGWADDLQRSRFCCRQWGPRCAGNPRGAPCETHLDTALWRDRNAGYLSRTGICHWPEVAPGDDNAWHFGAALSEAEQP